ncbi:MAG: uracil-DNA glycosylase [Rickettsiales bacterium]|nr:uracil-DNA glycosylase [Rickettsiales bacterium]
MSKLEAIQFYLDNDLNEILSEEPINHLMLKEKPTLAKVEEKKRLETKTTQTQIETIKEKKESRHFIKPEFSTNNALSKLAKKFSTGNADNSISINAIVDKAKEMAQNAKSLDELRKAVEEFDGCNLKKMATNTVFCDGNPDADVMIIGEAPGNHEDLQGIPFCDDAGQMLDQMFSAIHMSRQDNLYMTNVLFWRPPGNRKPTEEELTICKPFVQRHIQLIDPELIILVGGTAMNTVLGLDSTISKVRGEFMDFSPEFLDKTIKTFAIFHPSYLMRQSTKKRIAWQDLLALEQFLKEND